MSEYLIPRRAAVLGLLGGLASGSGVAFAQQRGDGGPPWMTRRVSGPGLVYRTFQSAAAGVPVSFHVYAPSQYEREPERRFPVIYWLHGSEPGLSGIPVLARMFDRAIHEGKAPPMIVVFPNGRGVSMWCDARDGSSPVETTVVRELVPFVDSSMRTIPALEGRIIEGFSMGGYGAARLGFTYPDLFGAVSMFGAGPLHPDFEVLPSNAALRERVLESVYGGELDYFRALSPWRIAERNSPLLGGLPLRLAIGTRDATLPANRDFHRHLSALGIPHDYVEVPGVAHEPAGLIEGLGDQMWAFYRSVLGSI